MIEPALEQRGWYLSFAGNVTYPKAPELREAARRAPADRLLAETDSPYLSPQPVRGRRTSPPTSCTRSQRSRRRAERTPGSSSRRSTPTQRRVRPVSVFPKKQLGQHFLVDENILGVIARLADLATGGRRARGRPGSRGAHAVSGGPRRARPRGRDRPHPRAAPRESRSTTLHWGDALTLRPRGARSAAGKLVANLPYNVATPIVVESLDRLPGSSSGA